MLQQVVLGSLEVVMLCPQIFVQGCQVTLRFGTHSS
jgi:hypothetical protein